MKNLEAELTLLNQQILDKINQDFNDKEKSIVNHELSSIDLKMVMNGEYNLKNTHLAILTLAKGDLNEVIALTKSAKIDFRDVVMWAMNVK